MEYPYRSIFIFHISIYNANLYYLKNCKFIANHISIYKSPIFPLGHFLLGIRDFCSASGRIVWYRFRKLHKLTYTIR